MIKEPSFRIENGRKIYTTIDRIDCVRRPAPQVMQAKREPESNASSGDTTPTSPDNSDPDVVAVHMRFITADDAYPTIGWLGPQRVKYGHNNGEATRQIIDRINQASRPVPLMWNHSYDAHDIAGRIGEPYWENSNDIRAGVNGWTYVNRLYDPKAALGLETGELSATSISVIMEKERSHPDIPFEQFVELASEGHQLDGKDVAWLPTKCVEVLHHALVWSGADPNSGPRPIPETPAPAMAATKSVKKTAASAVNKPTGGINMDNSITILEQLCKDLGLDVILSEGAIPDDVPERLSRKIGAYSEAARRYAEIESRIGEIKASHLDPEMANCSTLDALSAISDRLSLAKYGEAYLGDLRTSALRAYDAAKADPKKLELTAEQKIVRGVIAASSDVAQLKAWIAEYEEARNARFGPVANMRSTVDEPLPPVTRSENSDGLTGLDADIHDSVGRMFAKKGGKTK